MNIVFPTDTKDTIDAIRNAIGRDVIFYVPSGIPCTGCGINPVTNLSINPFCNICGGEGWITTYSGTTMKAHVTWAADELLNWVTGGRILEGECRVQVEYIPSTISIVDTTDYLTVDGKDMIIKKKILRGVPEINRIILDLEER